MGQLSFGKRAASPVNGLIAGVPARGVVAGRPQRGFGIGDTSPSSGTPLPDGTVVDDQGRVVLDADGNVVTLG